MPVSSWSTAAGSNTSVGGKNIAENMAPDDVNDAMRAIMADARARFDNLGEAGSITVSFTAPAFTNAAYNSSAQYLTNSATPGAWYSALQGGQNATEVATGAIIVPVSATNHQTNAGAFYIRSDRAQPANGGDVAGYFQAVSNANNSAVFALNAAMADTTGKTGQILNNEIDVNVNVAGTVVTGLNLVLVDNTGGLLTGARNAFRADKAFGVQGWSNGFVTADGAIDTTGYAAFIGSDGATAGTNRDSQKIALVSYNTSNTRFIATILGDRTGGMAIRAGSAVGSIAFQPPDGSVNWAAVSASGLGYPTGTGGAVTQLTSKSTAAPTINKVCGQITLNNAALAANTIASFTLTNSTIAADDDVRVWVKGGNASVGSYRVAAEGNASGSRTIVVENKTGGSLSEALVLGFMVHKASIS